MSAPPDLHDLLVSTRARRLEGADPPHLDRSLRAVRRGYFRPADASLSSSEQHRLRIFATADARRDGIVFSHASAAELWGCPQLNADLAYVHTTVTGSARHTTAGVKVHRGLIPAGHRIQQPDGLWVTSREWTAMQVAATQQLPQVLMPLDHLVKDLVEINGCDADAIVEMLVELIPARMKGRVRAERHLRLADPRSGSAGESLSRGQMVLLGVPMPNLQVRFARGDGPGDDIVDFDWPELDVFGEFDGKAKYFQRDLTSGRSPAEILWDEKRREDRIRRRRPRGARWGWDEALSRSRLARALAAAGILPERGVSR